MPEYICEKTCYFNATLYRQGDIAVFDESIRPPAHFRPLKEKRESNNGKPTMSELVSAASKAMAEGFITKDGRPEVKAMEQILGRDITSEQRDSAYEELKRLNREKEDGNI